MTEVLLGLGSNKNATWMGKTLSPLETIIQAEKELKKIFLFVKFSRVYKTRALYFEAQEDFLNVAALCVLKDEVSPFSLLKMLQKIEADFGRNRAKEFRNGPRPLDIDIEFFGSKKIFSKTLEIPHPRIFERAFVLIPALEVLAENADFIESENFFSDEKISAEIDADKIAENAKTVAEVDAKIGAKIAKISAEIAAPIAKTSTKIAKIAKKNAKSSFMTSIDFIDFADRKKIFLAAKTIDKNGIKLLKNESGAKNERFI